MNIAILIFGQFRSYKKNLIKNLDNLKDNLLENNNIDVYILTDEKGNYSKDNENEIKTIFEKYNCNIKLLEKWEHLIEYHEKDKILHNYYNKNVKNKDGFHPFTANLWYRRYVLSELIDKKYDIYMMCRLFDTIIEKRKTDDTIKKIIYDNYNNYLLTGSDQLYISSYSIFYKFIKFGNDFPLYHDDLWNYIRNELKKSDPNLCNRKEAGRHPAYRTDPTYCSEVQVFTYMYNNNIPILNIRHNKCGEITGNELFYIVHCPHRNYK